MGSEGDVHPSDGIHSVQTRWEETIPEQSQAERRMDLLSSIDDVSNELKAPAEILLNGGCYWQ